MGRGDAGPCAAVLGTWLSLLWCWAAKWCTSMPTLWQASHSWPFPRWECPTMEEGPCALRRAGKVGWHSCSRLQTQAPSALCWCGHMSCLGTGLAFCVWWTAFYKRIFVLWYMCPVELTLNIVFRNLPYFALAIIIRPSRSTTFFVLPVPRSETPAWSPWDL